MRQSFTLPVLAAWAVMAICSQAEADPFRLIVTDLETPLVPNSVMDLAVSGGYFDRAGVDVDLVRVQQTPMAVAALQAGEGEMANIAVDSLLQLVARGATDLRAVMSPNKSLPFLIAAQPGVLSPADLAGRTFGVGRVGSLDHTLSMKVLSAAGVDTASLQVVTLGQPAVRAQALVAGQIDATTMSVGTLVTLPNPDRVRVLIDQDAYYKAAPVVTKVNVVNTTTLTERRPEVEAVIEALTLASRDFAANQDLWVNRMAAARTDVDVSDLKFLAAAYANSWSVNGGLQRDELQFTQDWLYDGEDFADLPEVPLADWVDFGPVDAVLLRIGTAQLGMDETSR